MWYMIKIINDLCCYYERRKRKGLRMAEVPYQGSSCTTVTAMKIGDTGGSLGRS